MPKLTSRKALSDITVKNIKAKGSRFEVPDSIVPGLRLIVQTTGAKSWAVRTRVNGKLVKITLGPVMLDALDLKAVRDDARKALEDAQAGLLRNAGRLALPAPEPAPLLAFPAPMLLLPSPIEDQAGTVGALWREYLDKHLAVEAKGGVEGGTYKRFKGVFGDTPKTELDAMRPLPRWRARPLAEIKKRDCLEVLDAAALRGPEARISTIVVLSSFFNWAVERDHIAFNPVAGQSKPDDDGRDRYLDDGEMTTFWRGCETLGRTDKSAGSVMGPLFQLLLLTGQRRSEVAGMRYSEIEGRYWTIPSERVGNKSNPHLVYLSDMALAVLAKLPRVIDPETEEPSDFVFTTNGTSHSSGYSKAKADLVELVPDLAHWTLHDLRRSFTTGCARIGLSEITADRCLNHGKKKKRKGLSKTAPRYNRHEYVEEKRDVWERWSAHIAGLLNDQPSIQPSDEPSGLPSTTAAMSASQ